MLNQRDRDLKKVYSNSEARISSSGTVPIDYLGRFRTINSLLRAFKQNPEDTKRTLKIAL